MSASASSYSLYKEFTCQILSAFQDRLNIFSYFFKAVIRCAKGTNYMHCFPFASYKYNKHVVRVQVTIIYRRHSLERKGFPSFPVKRAYAVRTCANASTIEDLIIAQIGCNSFTGRMITLVFRSPH